MRKDPARRFQHMDDIKVALQELKEESDSGHLTDIQQAPPARQSRAATIYAGLATVAVLAAGLFVWQSRRPAAPSAGLTLRQLTQDPGLTTEPAISPDGKLL